MLSSLRGNFCGMPATAEDIGVMTSNPPSTDPVCQGFPQARVPNSPENFSHIPTKVEAKSDS